MSEYSDFKHDFRMDYETGDQWQSQKFMKNLMNDRFQGSMNDAISFMWY